MNRAVGAFENLTALSWWGAIDNTKTATRYKTWPDHQNHENSSKLTLLFREIATRIPDTTGSFGITLKMSELLLN
jgi:hypothetical protein